MHASLASATRVDDRDNDVSAAMAEDVHEPRDRLSSSMIARDNVISPQQIWWQVDIRKRVKLSTRSFAERLRQTSLLESGYQARDSNY
jgi:hypothetical protein